MSLTVDELKKLYVKLDGAESVVAGCSTIVEVLNAIAAKYDGKDDALLNPDAISNITEIADKIGGGGAPSDALLIKGLTKIVPSDYRNNREITSVEIPGSILEIGRMAFNGCENLTKVTLGEGVQTIGDSAFEGTLIETPVILPNSLISIGANAFKDVGAEIRCRFSADSPAATNAPWGATGNVIFDYAGG